MNPDPGATELQEPDKQVQVKDQEDLVLAWVPSARRLISGLLGMNVVLLGAALVAGRALNPEGLRHQEPQVFMLLLMGGGLVWMLWYLLWARRQPGISPHLDHHAGGLPVTLVLLLFAALSLLLYLCRVGYLISVSDCKPAATLISPFVEAPFLTLQTYLLWAHSKDCIHKHRIITRSGLMLVLSADLLLWLTAVTEDTIHQEIELEKQDHGLRFGNANATEDSDSTGNGTGCRCSSSSACLTFRKGFEVLYPFTMEFYLMAGCMIYVMWKNVGRRVSPDQDQDQDPDHHHHHQASNHKLTLRLVLGGGVVFGPALGALVLAAGATVFVLYQVWVSRRGSRDAAFLVFYGYHLVVVPLMSLSSLAGMLVHRLEARAHEAGHNPTRSLDVLLLVAAALGQLALSYFSLVAALALGTGDPLGDLDLAYSLLSLLELVLQNIFIIEGLHRHPSLRAKRKERRRSSIFKPRKKADVPSSPDGKKANVSLLEGKTSAPPAAAQGHDGKKPWAKRAMQEICAFLILSNVMLWVIPAFGVHPQLENGLGKQFFGFSSWFVLVNLGQPLSVFYRMHSVGALMELLISA